jgi:hypothetical protein
VLARARGAAAAGPGPAAGGALHGRGQLDDRQPPDLAAFADLARRHDALLYVDDAADLDAVGRHLFDRGVYVTLAPYPVVPRREVGFRVQVTAANTTEQLELLLTVLEEVDDRFGLRRPHP